jgi:endonuclease YncB( thermonuclease family)
MKETKTLNNNSYLKLLEDLKEMLTNGKDNVETEASKKLILTYWKIGKRINQETLTKNSGYKTSIIKELTKQLDLEKTTLSRCLTFYKIYKTPPNNKNLSWSHYKDLLSIKDESQRQQLENQAQQEDWSRQKLLSAIKQLNLNANSKHTLKRPTKPSYIYKAKTLSVIDGDTIILDIDLGFQTKKEQRIRLSQIDAPEMDTKAGIKSFHHLRNKLANIEEVVIQTKKVDIYGRYLGHIFYNKTNEKASIEEIFSEGVYLNDELLKEGYVERF